MIVDKKMASYAKPAKRGESALERLLKRINRAEEFPTISRYVMEINQKLAANPDDSNATDLANVILKDHALTSKLLKMVNSAFYGLAAGKVSTVTRAVVVLGYENVRLATLSLMLFEHIKSKSNSTYLKEVVVGSFWSGIMARELACMQGLGNPEEAFVCAMMSHLGKLVMIHYLPDQFRRICICMADESLNETRAARSACGVTYDELGMAVARQWSFPPQICDAIQPLSRDELQDKNHPPQRLRAVSSFVRELCDTIHAGRLAADKNRLQKLLERYRPHITVSKKQLKTLIKDSVAKVNQHAQALNLNTAQSTFLDRLSKACATQRQAPRSATIPASLEQAMGSFHLTDDTRLKANARIPGTRNPKDIIMEGIQELSEIMITDYDIDTIALMSLEIFYRAMDFQRALMFIQDSASKRMSVRFGYGHNCQQLISRVHFQLGASKDLFNLSIRVGKDLIVADSYDEKMNHIVPAWYREKIDAPAFVFLPVVFQKVCIGALYADRDTEGLPVSETEHRYLSMLRNQLLLSIKYRQKSF
jgi:eukaryotic-like serine/threonine-protein kinase